MNSYLANERRLLIEEVKRILSVGDVTICLVAINSRFPKKLQCTSQHQWTPLSVLMLSLTMEDALV